ncbi:GTP-binding conserved hypothetical domain-containing protein, putative [Eimeria acervulina]|uniref:GTP-binding conserved hypothetical domain-containing protein, putative n=1 Tax=Eimeria acervulina TaxID=5801 RepID=U6GDA9_EIMAC|nr:GTP-binding conserved hypothetical domain-containing protein, putative [Eimeria acervulina]CDI78256.1 GTP-binding conserved hypothetical domain-containing protein, putative [Eimeria acervulina]
MGLGRKRDPSWGSYWTLSVCNGNLGSILHLVPLGITPSLGARGISSSGGPPPQLIPLRRRLRAIKRLDPKIQHHVLREGLGRPRCHRAQRLLKIGDPHSVSARCPFFLQQLKPRLRLWKKALTVEELPPPLYPEVAFAGRSNAGKSTLLNELCGRSGTAAVSRRPGSTQALFFFKAGSPCCLCLVDLPGYGYAEADAAKRLQWTEMSLFYLKARPNLKRVFLLVDARWGLKASDISLLSFFERRRIPFQLVLTKADLPEQKALIKILQILSRTDCLALQASEEVKRFKGCAGAPLAVSALRHRGMDSLRAEIDKLRLSKELVIGRLRLKASRGNRAAHGLLPSLRTLLFLFLFACFLTESPPQFYERHFRLQSIKCSAADTRRAQQGTQVGRGLLCFARAIQAANLAEARRLKKESRKVEKDASSSLATEQTRSTSTLAVTVAAAPWAPRGQRQQQGQALDDPVARALERWGASLASTTNGSLDRGHTQREGALASDAFCAGAVPEDPTAGGEGHSKCGQLRLAPVSSQAEGGEDSVGGDAFEAEEAIREENTLSSALAAAVDRAAGALPLPDMSCAEALIGDLLPTPCQPRRVHESTQPQREPSADAVPDRYTKEIGTDSRSAGEIDTDSSPVVVPVPHALISCSLREKGVSSGPIAGGTDSAWAATVFREVRFESSGAVADQAGLQSFESQDMGFKGHTDCEATSEVLVPLDEASALMAEWPEPEVSHPQLAGKQSPSTAVQDDPWEAPALPASKRPLDILRANDWRARRVGHAAVEVDMGLPWEQDAAGSVATLHLGSCRGDYKRYSPMKLQSLSQASEVQSAEVEGGHGPFPDLSAVLKAQQQQQQQQQRKSNSRLHKHGVFRRSPSRAPLGGAVLLDEETLAAEDLGCSRTRAGGRIGSAPDPSNYTGFHELDMQRNFDQKWRHELLPVGDASQASKIVNSEGAERQGAEGSAQRSSVGWSNPRSIPEEYIGTGGDRVKGTAKRLALQILLQRAREAHRPTDRYQSFEERNRSTADSLLFSAAQRRQERRLKELAKKSNKRQGRSKEMTWDVAYRKWARWARAHPALAREAPRPSKVQLLAAFRQKLGKKANRQRKELQQRNQAAQTAVAGRGHTPRQNIEEIRKEALDALLHARRPTEQNSPCQRREPE